MEKGATIPRTIPPPAMHQPAKTISSLEPDSREDVEWRCTPVRGDLSRPAAQQNNLDRLKHDPEIQAHGSVLDVEEVVLQLLASIFHRVAVLVLNLSPPGNPRPPCG